MGRRDDYQLNVGTGKVWHALTDDSRLSTYALNGLCKEDEQPCLHSFWSMALLCLYLSRSSFGQVPKEIRENIQHFLSLLEGLDGQSA